MFDFLGMIDNYEERKVDRFERTNEHGETDLIVDTCLVTDSKQPYETAVSHKAYNNGKWIVVGTYDAKEEAQTGHNRWVEKMTSEDLPDIIIDVSTAGTAGLLDIIDDENWREIKKKVR